MDYGSGKEAAMKLGGINRSVVILLFTAALAAGCAAMKEDVSTRYQPAVKGEGYAEKQLSKNSYEVTFAANVNTLPEQAQHYLLYRCAELTLAQGFDYFIIKAMKDLSQINPIVEPGRELRVEHRMIQREAAPDYQYTIEMYSLPVSSSHPKAQLAKEVIKRYEAEIKRP
jgi:hypothetical protein